MGWEPPAISVSFATQGGRGTHTSLVRFAALLFVTLTMGMWCLALLLATRRFQGALSQPLRVQTLFAIAGSCVALGLGVRVAAARLWARTSSGTPWRLWLMLVPGAAICLLLASLSLPGTAAWSLFGAWLLVAVGEAVSATSIWKRGHQASLRVNRCEEFGTEQIEIPPTRAVGRPAGMETVTQSWQRTKTADGDERVRGSALAEFAAGQKIAYVHIPFCPPLAGRPRVTVSLSGFGATSEGATSEGATSEGGFGNRVHDSGPIQVTVAQSFSYGVRIDVRRRADVSQALVLPVDFEARP